MSIAGRFGWRWYAGVAVVAAGLAPIGSNTTSRAPVTQPVAAALHITSPEGGAVIRGNVAFLSVEGGGPSARFYVLVDQEPPPDGAPLGVDPSVVRSDLNPIPVPGLSLGAHRLTVVAGDADGRRAGEAKDSVLVSVAGPALVAQAPATSTEGEPWTIKVAVVGVRLAKPDGDTSGRKGHLEYIIDGGLPALGTPVSEDAEGIVHTEQSNVPFTGLEAGEHTVWVVLSDGTHRPLAPYVAAMVRVTIIAP